LDGTVPLLFGRLRFKLLLLRPTRFDMGHRSLTTTMGYFKLNADTVAQGSIPQWNICSDN
jgi:hypothetical protein